MGWKKIKEQYCINHNVRVTEEGICIGSGYIPDIIVIGLNGVLKKRYDGLGNRDLERYQREMEDNPELLKQLVLEADEFTNSITVYTYNGGDIVEKKCEMPGWPNVTHEGEIMYENTFSADKEFIITEAKQNADCAVRVTERGIAETEKRLKELHLQLAQYKANREKLENDYPTSTLKSEQPEGKQ